MSDLLVALLVFLALGSLSDFLTSGKRRHLLLVAAWSWLAILTKGTGWLLLLPILFGPSITRRTKFYFTWTYWVTLGVIVVASAPFFVWMSALQFGYPTGIKGHLHRLAVILRQLTAFHYIAAVPPRR
jgi:hypothetical protein